jgi:hypothetical protein
MTNTSDLPDIRKQLGDRYAIERELGRGGMGAVYLARDLRLDRPVALKVLPAELAQDSSLRERFLRETRTAASFSHPNIVPVHAVEDRDGILAFAMGFVEGESVAERVKRAGPLEVRSVVRLLQDIGYALAYAHGRGVVHRDIKPDNIMLERATGRALLMDFGISRSITAKVEEKGKAATQGLTRVGEVVGTAEYMSPEQASGDVVDGRSDLYSLGLVALFALTGRPAITGETTQQILVKQLTETPPPATSLRPDLPESLGAAIDRCVAKEPSARFATAEALVEAIDDARLAPPEIPVPIRLFAQEAGTLSLVIVFLTMISWLFFEMLSRKVGTAWAGIPASFLGAVVITRALMVSSEARRLAVIGYRPDDVLNGLRATVDEREAQRQQLRADPDTRRRRRKTVIAAVLLLPIAFLLINASLNVGFSLGTKAEVVQTESRDATQRSLGRLVMAASGLSLLGVGFLLLARSPFRMPPGERLFRVLWLGAPGRTFVRFSSRNVAPPSSGKTALGLAGTRANVNIAEAGRAAAPVVAMEATPTDQMRSLEDRVAALERWRDGAST